MAYIVGMKTFSGSQLVWNLCNQSLRTNLGGCALLNLKQTMLQVFPQTHIQAKTLLSASTSSRMSVWNIKYKPTWHLSSNFTLQHLELEWEFFYPGCLANHAVMVSSQIQPSVVSHSPGYQMWDSHLSHPSQGNPCAHLIRC